MNTSNAVSLAEASQDFSRVTRMVDEQGSAIITKNNKPRYLLVEFNKSENEQTVSDDDLLQISNRLMKQNKEAYEVLAQ